MDNSCPIKTLATALALKDSKTVMQFFRNRAVPSGVLRGKREQHSKSEHHEAASEKRKIRCIPTFKVLEETFYNASVAGALVVDADAALVVVAAFDAASFVSFLLMLLLWP